MGYAILGNKHGSSKAVDDLITSYYASAKEDITAGDFCNFVNGTTVERTFEDGTNTFNMLEDTAASSRIKAFDINSTTVLLFINTNNAGYGCAYVIDCSNVNRLSILYRYCFNEIAGDFLVWSYQDVVQLTALTYVVSYFDGTNDKLYAFPVTVDQNTLLLTMGARTQIAAENVYELVLSDVIGTDRTLLIYQPSGSAIRCVCIKYVAGTLAIGSIITDGTYVSQGPFKCSVVTFGATSYVLLVFRWNDTGYLYSVVIAITDVTPSFGTFTQINYVSTYYIFLCKISDTKFIATYQNNVTSNCYGCIITLTNNTQISAGAQTQVCDVIIYYADLTLIDQANVLLTGYNGSKYFVLLTISGTNISAGIKNNFVSLPGNDVSKFVVSLLSNNIIRMFARYSVTGDPGGLSRTASLFFKLNEDLSIPTIYFEPRKQQPKVIAVKDIIKEQVGKFGINGIFKFTEITLIPNEVYYCNNDGKLSMIVNDYRVGIAINENELLLDVSFWDRGL